MYGSPHLLNSCFTVFTPRSTSHILYIIIRIYHKQDVPGSTFPLHFVKLGLLPLPQLKPTDVETEGHMIDNWNCYFYELDDLVRL